MAEYEVSITTRRCTTCRYWMNSLRTYDSSKQQMYPDPDYLCAFCGCERSSYYNEKVNHDFYCRKWYPAEKHITCDFDVKTYTDDVYYQFLGHAFSYTASVLPFRDLFTFFEKTAKQYETNYISYYNAEVKNLPDLYEIGIDKMFDSLSDVVQVGIKVLEKYGVWGFDETSILNKGGDYLNPSAVLEKYNDLAAYIENALEDSMLASLERRQKAANTHWQGGGFGLSGSIKGALVAGAINSAKKSWHTAKERRLLEKDIRELQNLQEKVMQDPSTRKTLSDTVYKYSKRIGQTIIDILKEHGKLSANAWGYSQNEYIDTVSKLHRLYNNQQKLPENLIDSLLSCLQSNPFDEKLYILLYTNGYIGSSELLQHLKFWGLDTLCLPVMTEIDEEKVQAILMMDEESVIAKHDKIQALTKLRKDLFDADQINRVNKSITQLSKAIEEEERRRVLAIEEENSRRVLYLNLTSVLKKQVEAKLDNQIALESKERTEIQPLKAMKPDAKYIETKHDEADCQKDSIDIKTSKAIQNTKSVGCFGSCVLWFLFLLYVVSCIGSFSVDAPGPAFLFGLCAVISFPKAFTNLGFWRKAIIPLCLIAFFSGL